MTLGEEIQGLFCTMYTIIASIFLYPPFEKYKKTLAKRSKILYN